MAAQIAVFACTNVILQTIDTNVSKQQQECGRVN